MPEFISLWNSGPLFAQAEHFRMGTDCVLLPDFAALGSAKRGIDLGCASGALALLLLSRSERLHMTGLEILPEAAELAKKNMAVNGLEERSEMLCGDIRKHRELFRTGSFDLVISNPPYFPVGSGLSSPDGERAGAREEASCTLDELCAAAAFLLRTGGSFAMVYRPERLADAICSLRAHGLEAKRLRFVSHRIDSAPSLVLIESRRGGKPGIKIEPPLILTNSDGTETDEIKIIYHRI